MRILCSYILLLSTGGGCAVEVGNAGGGKKKTGKVQIVFTQEQKVKSESLNLFLDSFTLLNEEEAITVAPSVSSVDLFKDSEPGTTVVAESDVSVGNYSFVSVTLDEGKSVSYTNFNKELMIVQNATRQFYLKKPFVVTEGETTRVVILLDPYQSIQVVDESLKTIDFNPRAFQEDENEFQKFSGTTTETNAEWVCAYAYPSPNPLRLFREDDGGRGGVDGDDDFDGVDGDQDGRGGNDGDNDGPGGVDDGDPWDEITTAGGVPSPAPAPAPVPAPTTPPVVGTPVVVPEKSESKETLVKDENPNCERAFARVPVVEQSYLFRYLIPGSYSLRVFGGGGYSDPAEDIVIQSKEAP